MCSGTVPRCLHLYMQPGSGRRWDCAVVCQGVRFKVQQHECRALSLQQLPAAMCCKHAWHACSSATVSMSAWHFTNPSSAASLKKDGCVWCGARRGVERQLMHIRASGQLIWGKEWEKIKCCRGVSACAS